MDEALEILKTNADGTHVVNAPDAKEGDAVQVLLNGNLLGATVVGNSRGAGRKKVRLDDI